MDYRETDRICQLLSEQAGPISVMARGARRSRKRFGGALSLFVIGEATFRPAARDGGLATLERYDCLEDLAPRISSDVVAVAHGSYIIELARELWPEGQPDAELFALVCEALRALSAGPPSPGLLRAYELQLLAAVGLAPSLDRCVACGRSPDATEPVSFNVPRGGLVCGRCPGQGGGLAPSILRLLLTLSRTPLREARARQATPEAARGARETMVALVHHHLGKPLKSLQFILELR